LRTFWQKDKCDDSCKEYVAAHKAADEYEKEIAHEDAENVLFVAAFGGKCKINVTQSNGIILLTQ